MYCKASWGGGVGGIIASASLDNILDFSSFTDKAPRFIKMEGVGGVTKTAVICKL